MMMHTSTNACECVWLEKNVIKFFVSLVQNMTSSHISYTSLRICTLEIRPHTLYTTILYYMLRDSPPGENKCDCEYRGNVKIVPCLHYSMFGIPRRMV